MKKNNIYGILIALVIITIVGLSLGGSQSTIDNIVSSDLDNCRIVLEGDVCSDYTDCGYDSARKTSCIKGYEIKTPTLEEPRAEVGEFGGESNE